ncbi:DUF5810 domain-containing protein [Salinigranum sp. GCM10025319]|uniref:DUF5810 domain-containing protein n=1 Tax=Salinigranum sp. GCM10025319 TaxID=3252687 RepID=UPI0036064B02
MGYACPVCDEPQRDAEHLANHLAFQAMTHGDDHESWLDEHAPDWASGGPADLAPLVAEHAPETEYEVVFEDTTEADGPDELYDPDLQGELDEHADPHPPGTGRGHGHDHSHEHGRDDGATGVDIEDLDPETREVVEDARELTREMLAADDDEQREE